MCFSASRRLTSILSRCPFSSRFCLSAKSRIASAARSSSTDRSSSCLARSSTISSCFVSSSPVCNKLLGHDVTASVSSATSPPSPPDELSPFADAGPAVLSAAAALLLLTLAVLRCTPCALLQLLLEISSGGGPTSCLTPVFLQRSGFRVLVGRPDPSRSTESELVMFHPSAPSSPYG